MEPLPIECDTMSTHGEYQSGNARIECDVDLEVYVEGANVVIESTADRPSARSQQIRCVLSPERARDVLQDLRLSAELAERRS